MPSSITLPGGWNQPIDTLSILISFAALYVLYFIVSSVYIVYFGPLSKYPGPKSWAFSRIPRILTMVQGGDAETYSRLHQQYGPVVRTGPNELSYTGSAQVWKDIHGFKKAGRAHPYKEPQFYGKPLNGVPGIITADDANHGRQRKILSHAFSDKALKEQEPLLKKWASLMRKKLAERANGTEKADMLKFYNCTTFDIMGDLTFSEGLDMLNDSEYSPWVKTIFASIKNATFFRGMKDVNEVFRYVIDQFVFKSKIARQKAWEHVRYTSDRVDRRLAREPEHEDLWSKILKKDESDGGLSLGEHHTNASVFMIAGTETTATALSGTTYHLLKNPEVLKELIKEVRETFTEFDDITLEGLARMKYLQAVLQEGLRMYPPVPIALPRRIPKEGSVILDEFVPGDTTVGVNHFATYRSPEHFKNADEFHPERWLGDAAYKDDHLDAFEPFQVGPRNCLGKNLAWHEMRMLMVTVLLHFDLQMCDEADNWVDQKVYTLWEKKPLMCTLTPA